MAKPTEHRPSVFARRRAAPIASLLGMVVLAAGMVAFGGGRASPQAAAQADPTPTSVRLTFNTPTPVPDEAPTSDASSELQFAADAWAGGYFRGDAEFYGRPWTALYGAQSDFPRGTLTLTLADDPADPVELIFDGLDDELPARNRIAIEVNGQRVFTGESPFADWDGVGNGANAPWTTVRVTIPPDLLVKGRNRIAVRNLTEAANFGSPPYVLLSQGSAFALDEGLFGEPANRIAVDVEVVD